MTMRCFLTCYALIAVNSWGQSSTLLTPEKQSDCLRVRVPQPIMQWERIPVTLEITNGTDRAFSFFKPIFMGVLRNSLVNVDIELTKKDSIPGIPQRVGHAPYVQRLRLHEKSHSATIIPGGTWQCQFNLRKYLDVPSRPGAYELLVFVDVPGGRWRSNTITFEITSRGESRVNALQTAIDRVTVAANFADPSDAPEVMHKAITFKEEDGTSVLAYDSDLPGWEGACVVAQGGKIEDFRIIRLSRSIPRDWRITYDDRWVIHHHNAPHVMIDTEPAHFPVSYCEYVGIVFLMNKTLFVWTVGAYGPLSPDVAKGWQDAELWKLICPGSPVAREVDDIMQVTDKGGLISISYIGDGHGKATVVVDQLGKIVEK